MAEINKGLVTDLRDVNQQDEFETWLLDDEEDDFVVLDSVDLQDPEPLKNLVSLINETINNTNNPAMVSILADQQWNEVLNKLGPKNMIQRGLGKHFNILTDPRNRAHVLVGPGAVGSVADHNRSGTSEVVYSVINAAGKESNEVFERGCADIIAARVAEESGVDFYSNNYPAEASFVRDLIKSFKEPEDDEFEWVLMLKNDPDQFFEKLENSNFFKWWEKFAEKRDVLPHFIRLMDSLKSPNGQLEGSFLQWAQNCAKRYAEYITMKRKKQTQVKKEVIK